jgi:glycosyltransferase involved in cell wall biosynthesis
MLVGPMRRWDYQAAQRPDYFIANSSHTKEQIKKYYGRDADVIYPPVDIDRFNPTKKVIKSGFLIAGRQTPYKKFDLAVEACTKLNMPLTVIGNGPEHDKLVDMAGPRVNFLNKVAEFIPNKISKSAEKFSKENFTKNLQDYINKLN